ncbi:MAG: DUF4065 domain-containing protein [Bacteroidales bacterium]|nr:DUF4065 domain-containing protein [Bacteroidales bacterium]
MAYNAIDIAKKIVCQADAEHGDTISNFKLQRLLYYMQGFHLAFFNEPFFNESIEAWTYGAVVPVVFQEFKKYEKRAVNPDNYHDELVLTNNEQQMFDMTHTEGPWKNHGIGDVITNEELRSFFLTQIDRDEPFQTVEFGRIKLTENMREAVHKVERSMDERTCLTEEIFQMRFA